MHIYQPGNLRDKIPKRRRLWPVTPWKKKKKKKKKRSKRAT
jgi:hypothetical protein